MTDVEVDTDRLEDEWTVKCTAIGCGWYENNQSVSIRQARNLARQHVYHSRTHYVELTILKREWFGAKLDPI